MWVTLHVKRKHPGQFDHRRYFYAVDSCSVSLELPVSTSIFDGLIRCHFIPCAQQPYPIVARYLRSIALPRPLQNLIGGYLDFVTVLSAVGYAGSQSYMIGHHGDHDRFVETEVWVVWSTTVDKCFVRELAVPGLMQKHLCSFDNFSN